ncbi:hypothetical protein J3R30DRAFT_3527425 [Lentinula aciculospora]|uniref:Uncharacterized protein n=1 Tax=Lentinula aciculospora TaxID=153920 RepID=A0A9W8ZSV0_9AGAR|nr:hypothetical protein J3R30DRAFT_3599661 [Lentinula aciculospora]KAJ4471630.1 hypothetical protein J3R30DRAFT_3527425 [Lentinula aciculospora]
MPLQSVSLLPPSKQYKKRMSKKGLGLGINVIAASVLSASSSAYRHIKNQESSSSSSNSTTPKTPRTRPRSSTTATSRPVFLDKSNTTPNLIRDSKVDTIDVPVENLPVLTALRTKPAYYEELHTLSAYGELPNPVCPLLLTTITGESNCLPASSGDACATMAMDLVKSPTSSAARLFDVAKPPAMAKRRRYTVATSRPSLMKENESPLNSRAETSAALGGLGDVKEEGLSATGGSGSESTSTSATKQMTPDRSSTAVRSCSLPCDPPASCLEALETSNIQICSPGSEQDLFVPSTPKSPPIPAASLPIQGMNVNVRFIKHYPYMITESANSRRESESEEEGVLSRVKYHIVRV